MAFLRRLCSVARSRSRMFSVEHTTSVPNSTHKGEEPCVKSMSDLYSHVWKDPDPSEDVWADVRSEVSKCQNVTPISVDAVIMDLCIQNGNLMAASSYYKFMKKNNYDFHLAVIGKYFKTLVKRTDPLTMAEKMDVLHTYSVISEKYQYLDSVTTKTTIQLLSMTGNWMEAYRLMKKYETIYALGTSAPRAVACGAFRAGNTEIGFDLLCKMHDKGTSIMEDVYITYLEYCMTNKTTFTHNIEEMFKLWRKYSVMVSKDVLSKYLISCQKMGWSGTYTKISNCNTCENCGEQLSTTVFSLERYKELAEAVLQKGLINHDVYKTSTPKELKKFTEFVAKIKPYDIVIDALNIHYVTSPTSMNSIINYFSKRRKAILLLARKHLMTSIKVKQARKKATVYFVDNMSCDDLFLIYATLIGGSNAKFLSLDLMRQHKHKLQDLRLKEDFKRWQLTHQYLLTYGADQKINIIPPKAVDPRVQEGAGHWHIPFKLTNSRADTYEYPEQWVCLRR